MNSPDVTKDIVYVVDKSIPGRGKDVFNTLLLKEWPELLELEEENFKIDRELSQEQKLTHPDLEKRWSMEKVGPHITVIWKTLP